MTRFSLLILLTMAVAAGCGGQEPARETGTLDQPGAPAGTATNDVEITFRSDPDPPVAGANTIEVTVTDANGRPVTDASVTVEFFMAAMPEMKMPEMRNSAALIHEGDGRYRGEGQVMMAGPWDVTVTVARGDQVLGRRKVPVTAK